MSTVDAKIIEHITNGLNGGGGSSDSGNKDEETMTRVSTQNYYENDFAFSPYDGVLATYAGFHKKYLKTGLILKIKNSRSGEIESYVLIRTSDNIADDINTYDDPTKGNAKLVSLTSNRVFPAILGAYGGPTYAICVYADRGTYVDGGEECGIFTIDHMSHSTLVKIACNYHTTYDQDV